MLFPLKFYYNTFIIYDGRRRLSSFSWWPADSSSEKHKYFPLTSRNFFIKFFEYVALVMVELRAGRLAGMLRPEDAGWTFVELFVVLPKE